MHLLIPALVLALASLATSQTPTPGFDVITSLPNQTTYEVGWAIPIIWQDSLKIGNITLTLIGGPDPSNLSPVMTIASAVPSNITSWAFTIPDEVGSKLLASYSINLTLDSDPNTSQYSPQFYIVASNDSTTTTTSTIQSTTSSSPSSSGATTTTSSQTKPTGSSSNSTSATASPAPSGTDKSGAGTVVRGGLAVFAGVLMALLLQ